MEDKDAIIRQQWLIIKDQEATINTQRCEIAYLKNEKHRFELIYTSPIWFLWWFWRSRFFPFSLIWGHQRVD
jgi:hypothetical protein